LDLLKNMLGLNKSAGEADEEEADDEPEDPSETNEDQGEIKNAGKIEKSVKNGGDLEDADEDPDDPAQTGDGAKGGSIITNKGKKIAKESSAAVKKSYEFDEQLFAKHFEETYGEVVEASEAVAELAKSVKVIGNAHNENSVLLKSVMEQNVVLAKAVGELLKSNASIAAELNEIKAQPVNAPSAGFVVMTKKADKADTSAKSLRKSDIQDAIVDAMNNGHEDASQLLKSLGVIHDQAGLKDFYDNVLPDDIKESI
jgi:hypothetical protein